MSVIDTVLMCFVFGLFLYVVALISELIQKKWKNEYVRDNLEKEPPDLIQIMMIVMILFLVLIFILFTLISKFIYTN